MARSIFDKSEWDFFWRFWDEAIQRIPGLKREALEAMGKAVLQEVREQIPRRGVNDQQGRVARWQEMRMGSKGGYVAVSPSTDEIVQVVRRGIFKREKTTSADVTLYLERGHGIRPPSGRAKRYVSRVESHRTYVPGRMFYSWAKQDAGKIALEEANRAMDQLTDIFADYLAKG